ncbi:hypothetical protein [Nocardia wallacei]|uniref:hypothetical protein n=1 Tax=Nocardia wallacei TaxID=480035 RepID=UPI0024582674|nr:hypothetical protein [Nocardia wallacei]
MSQPSRRVTPSGRWYAFAGALAAIGIVAAVAIGVLGFVRMSDRVDNFQRVEIPGSADVRITETGGYTVYFEYPSASSQVPEGSVNVQLADPDGAPVSLRDYDSELTYAFGGHEGRAGFSFDAARPGTYHLVTQGDSAVTAAVGRGIGTSMVTTILLAFGVAGAGVLAGLIMLIVVAIKRGSSKRRLAVAQGWGRYPQP